MSRAHQAEDAEDARFMRLALDEARKAFKQGEVPVGGADGSGRVGDRARTTVRFACMILPPMPKRWPCARPRKSWVTTA